MSGLQLDRKNLCFLSQYYKLDLIIKGPLNWNSKYVVYLIECQVCASRFLYTGSVKTTFWECLNNYNGAYPNLGNAFLNDKSITGLKQKNFPICFFQGGHSGIDDWKITLIVQVEGNLRYLRRKYNLFGGISLIALQSVSMRERFLY